MSNLMKIFLNIFLIYLINCSSAYQEIEENHLVLLKEGVDQALLTVTPGSKKMIVEIILSHPTNYNFTFNQYDAEDVESGEVQKRRLSTDYTENQEGIIDHEINYFGKNKYVLNIEEDMTKIALTFFQKKETENKEVIYVKYTNTEANTVEKDNYSSDQDIKIEKNKDFLNVTFDGIKLNDENMNVDNVSVTYYINLFDLEEIQSKYENVYIYAYTNDKPLYSTQISLKGKAVLKKNYLRIKAPLNNKKEQFLFIRAIISNVEEKDEQNLQYKLTSFNVEEESGEREWPEDEDIKEEEEEEEDENKKEKEKEKENKKESEEEKEKDEKKDEKINNETKLYIILICFVVSVICTFIGVFIYIKCFAKKDSNIEEDNDYKDVGGIVQNEDKKEGDGQNRTDEGKKINEEEE